MNGSSWVYPPDIGERIVKARLAAGFTTRASLARKIGVEARSLYRLEKGLNAPSATVSAALARELGVSTDWLLTGEGRGPHSPNVRPSESPQEVSR